jgi:hypothetical protein
MLEKKTVLKPATTCGRRRWEATFVLVTRSVICALLYVSLYVLRSITILEYNSYQVLDLDFPMARRKEVCIKLYE